MKAFLRLRQVDALLEELELLPFERARASAHGRIVAAAGYSRRKAVDRMIAATALVHDLTLVTLNGQDFRDIPDLRLEVWSAEEG